jgi:class 3 adenylate cyclase
MIGGLGGRAARGGHPVNATDTAPRPAAAAADPPARARVPLGRKLAALAALLVTAPLVVVGLVLIDVNADAVAILSRELQLEVVDDVARTIDQEFVEAQDGLDSTGRVLANAEISADAALVIALAMVEAHEALDHVAVYDARGQLIDVIREEGVSGLSPPRTLSEAMLDQAEQMNLATGRAALQAGEPRIPLAVPLRADGRVTGYVASMISLADVQRRVERISEGRFPGLHAPVFVVDEDRRILAHSDPARARSLAAIASEGMLAGADAETLSEDFSRSGDFVNADGARMVGSMAALPGRRWAVVVQVPAAYAYATLDRMRAVVLITVAIAIALALLVGVLAARRVTAPLAALTAFAGHLAARRFSERVEIRTHDELALLGGALTRAAADLEAGEARLVEEAAIRSDLGRYLPAELVESVVRREQDMSLGGVRRTVTVLFADVVSFTPLTEKLGPEDVVTILNELFTILTGIVFRHGGTVDKFVGDCVMAIWGAPTPQPDHARRALAAAEDMLTWLEVGNATWKERFGVTIHLAVGVNTGEAVVGNIGSKTRMEYTAIGDAVNVAARLEALARPQQILVSEATRDGVGDAFELRDVGVHTLPGRSNPVHLYEVEI